ncbi:MAG: DUF488 domain-containing protein [Actinomycetota bacterium]
MSVRVKRVDEPIDPQDGARVLVDDRWPPEVALEQVALDRWARAAAPSEGLVAWLRANPDRFEEFSERYRAELRADAASRVLADLRRLARTRDLTLVTASPDPDRSPAGVLARLLRSKR